MTLEQAQALTNDEIRVMIAALCDWTEISTRCMWGLPPGADDDGTEDCLKHFPNYPSDLNACADFERTLAYPKDGEYLNVMEAICRPARTFPGMASARVRCEAYVLTMTQP